MGSLCSQISIVIPQRFILGAFLESLRLIQDRSMELLQKLCADVATDRTWADKSLHTTNLCVADLEAQGLKKFPEWQKNEDGTGEGMV